MDFVKTELTEDEAKFHAALHDLMRTAGIEKINVSVHDVPIKVFTELEIVGQTVLHDDERMWLHGSAKIGAHSFSLHSVDLHDKAKPPLELPAVH